MGFIYFFLDTDIYSALRQAWTNVLVNINTPSFILSMGTTALLVSGTQFMLQVSDKFGPGVLWKFITGKYYHPKQEQRIFMFLDLKSSTTIAEKSGSERFFELLKEVYRDITDPIINSMGEIYQYVGDEVVITWPMGSGLRNNNCLECFFKIEEVIQKKRNYYLGKYDHVPAFKAGLHCGEATVGEIGVIKKDIVFSGDVLNTTSRIQEECNRLNVNILVSGDLLHQLLLNEAYEHTHLGEISLRGKEKKIELNTVRQKLNR